MGATTDLLAKVTDCVYLHPVTVALLKKPQRSLFASLGSAHLLQHYRQLSLDLLVDQILDGGQLFRGEWRWVREVESEPLDSDIAASLLYMGSEHAA